MLRGCLLQLLLDNSLQARADCMTAVIDLCRTIIDHNRDLTRTPSTHTCFLLHECRIRQGVIFNGSYHQLHHALHAAATRLAP